MTIKIVLLKSGEDIISDVKEMVVGEEDNPRVIGYFLHKPCVVKMTPPTNVGETDGDNQKTSFRVTLFPWMPLTKDETIPVSSDWVVTIVNPTDKLKDMYLEDVIKYGKNNKDDSADEYADSNQRN